MKYHLALTSGKELSFAICEPRAVATRGRTSILLLSSSGGPSRSPSRCERGSALVSKDTDHKARALESVRLTSRCCVGARGPNGGSC